MAASPGFEFVELDLDAEGRLTIYAGTSDCGQGHHTMYTQVACETLGLEPRDITFVQGDTGRVREGSGTSSSRSTTMDGSALRLAAEKIVDKGRSVAAILLDCGRDEIRFQEGSFLRTGTNQSVALAKVAEAANADKPVTPEIEPGLKASASHRTLWLPIG